MISAFVKENLKELQSVATAVRILGMDAVLKAKSGHVGLPLGGAEMATVLYFAALQHDPKNPQNFLRDRFVLSAGHGSMLQYACLHMAGYELSLEEIKNFRQLHSKTPGHPEYGHTPGVECTTGPLGQGIASAVGMAIAERMQESRLNSTNSNEKFEHNTFVIVGDGCLMEGVSAEASSLAGHLKLNKLITMYDSNKITIDGNTDISFTEDVAMRYKAYGWNILNADGNDFVSLATALDTALEFANQLPGTTGPTLIVCKGIPGKGSPKWEGKHKIHGNPMSAEDVIDAKKHLGVTETTPFSLPESCYAAAQLLLSKKTKAPFARNLLGKHYDYRKPSPTLLNTTDFALAKGKQATRVASGKALNALAKNNPALVGGSADLAGSNNTTLDDSSFVSPQNFAGRNVHFGVREHGMAAMINGMALHGSFVPYCATFAVFSDYMRPAIRMAAIMNIPSIFILTHDSYAVGEDGPTHQPVEHAQSLRAIPHLNVYRPADAFETFAAWNCALQSENKPTALLLTRQDLPDLHDEGAPQRIASEITAAIDGPGAYLLKDYAQGKMQNITLIASGSEVHICMQAAKILESKAVHNLSGETVTLGVRVVSAPAPQNLPKHPLALNSLVPENIPAIAVEAGTTQGWGDIVGRKGAVIGMTGFGASAPAQKLAEQFGFTAENIVQMALNHVNLR